MRSQKSSWSIKQLISHKASESHDSSKIEMANQSFCEISTNTPKRHSWLSQTAYTDVISSLRKSNSPTSAGRNPENSHRFPDLESYVRSLNLPDDDESNGNSSARLRRSPGSKSQSDIYFLAFMPSADKGSSRRKKSSHVTISSEGRSREKSKLAQSSEVNDKISHKSEAINLKSSPEDSATSNDSGLSGETKLDVESEAIISAAGTATLPEKRIKSSSAWYDNMDNSIGKKENKKSKNEKKTDSSNAGFREETAVTTTIRSSLTKKSITDASLQGSKKTSPERKASHHRRGSLDSLRSTRTGGSGYSVEPFYVECFSKRSKEVDKTEVMWHKKNPRKPIEKKTKKSGKPKIERPVIDVTDSSQVVTAPAETQKSSTGCHEALPLPSIPEMLTDLSKFYLTDDEKTDPTSPTRLPSPAWSFTAPQFLQGPIQIQIYPGDLKFPVTDKHERSDLEPSTGESNVTCSLTDTEWKSDEIEPDDILSWWSSFGFLGYGSLTTEPMEEDLRLMAIAHKSNVFQDQQTRGKNDEISFPLKPEFDTDAVDWASKSETAIMFDIESCAVMRNFPVSSMIS